QVPALPPPEPAERIAQDRQVGISRRRAEDENPDASIPRGLRYGGVGRGQEPGGRHPEEAPPIHRQVRRCATGRVGGPETRICFVSCRSASQKPPKRRWQSPRSWRLRTKTARSDMCPDGILAAVAR